MKFVEEPYLNRTDPLLICHTLNQAWLHLPKASESKDACGISSGFVILCCYSCVTEKESSFFSRVSETAAARHWHR